ncbi:MAG: hypothetical protein JWL90_1920, partial [Chthoniobacteraceae bacterium]|nr:hypothetical protein [Chthoniobacteraceae bacterium]
EPTAESLVAIRNSSTGLALKVVRKGVGQRTPVSIELTAPGVRDAFTGGIAVRGDIEVGKDSLIRVDPQSTVFLSGNTVSILGSIDAPAGMISISGGTNSGSLFEDKNRAVTTVYIGSTSVLSATGTTLLTPDPFGRKTGSVLPGGIISVTGNLVASSGARLDVSGTTGTLDLSPLVIQPVDQFQIPTNSGITAQLFSLRTVPTRLDSDGGTILLGGGQMLFSEATLEGNAGGPTAMGGNLSISSGRFYAPGVTAFPYDSTLVVSQNRTSSRVPLPSHPGKVGEALTSAHGAPVIGRGYFAADTFEEGGFDSLSLAGVVEFTGPVNIDARSTLKIADGGVLFADSIVRLSAPYVTLGIPFQSPLRPEDKTSPFNPVTFAPTHGAGSLIVTADLVDLGTISLQNIGRATISAGNGDIRGNGTFDIAGKLILRASQIYPTTAAEFNLVAYDYTNDDLIKRGSITVEGTSRSIVPLSAGGSLALYASTIKQNGVLRAPFGTITLGWDGSGNAPVDLLTGDKLAFPRTATVSLGTGSITSVSAIDPVTGLGILVPYGLSLDGNSWIDPRGVNITAGGLPEKSIKFSGGNLLMENGAFVDIRGGGDLLAYRWVAGNGGQTDILASAQSFAVIPDYSSNFSPYAPYNTSLQAANLIAGADQGYINGKLSAGDRIYLGASESLPSGFYTLLPARYALIPGAVLVTPKSGIPAGTIELPDGSSLVSGYRFNDLNNSRAVPTTATRFEVAGGKVVRARAQYDEYLAGTFLKESARDLNVELPRLPTDSGYLLFQATQSMNLLGTVASQSISGGRGAWIDIDTPLEIVISNHSSNGAANVVSLDASTLNSFGAESLLIGGRRTQSAIGTTVSVQSAGITVDNGGTPLAAPDLILASKNKLTLAAGAQVKSSGALSSPAETLLISGDGALLRVSEDVSATIVRTVTPSTSPSLVVEAGAQISGQSLTLDSTALMSLDPSATLAARAYSINSGRISLQLENPGELLNEPGLVLAGNPFRNLQSARSLSLLSYSTLDVYGTGQVGNGSLAKLSLSAGEIRGFNQQNGVAGFNARTIFLSNSSKALGSNATTAPSGTLSFNSQSLYLGANQVALNQYSEVILSASKGVIGTGNGGLSTQAALTLFTPMLTGAAGADRSLTAGGVLSLKADAPGAGIPGGLGSTLALTGTEVNADTDISLPSGSLSIRATAGNLNVTGELNVRGSALSFYDVLKYTNAGEIQLIADHGDVRLSDTSILNIAAHPGGGDAGSLVVSTANGAFLSAGTLLGKGGLNGKNGSFELDTAVLPSTASLAESLAMASLDESQTIRVRTGDVTIDGTIRSHTFILSADQGSIAVTGELDASGQTGGAISLAANGSVILKKDARLTVAGHDFSSAGKGGTITLEAGTQRNGIAGAGSVDIQTGSMLDLSVASLIAGDALTPGSSAYQGEFGGKLHLRAPQNVSSTDLLVAPINGTVLGASSILVEGYRIYDLTGSDGTIGSALQLSIQNNGRAFLGAPGAATGGDGAILQRLLAANPDLGTVTVLAPGAEIINRSGDLVLGAVGSTAASDWNLSTFRFGSKSAPGVLTMRASGNLTFFNTLSDGFATSAYNAQLLSQNAALPINTQSWSYRLTSGADMTAADFGQTVAPSSLNASAGFLQLGKNNGSNSSDSNGSNNAPGEGALTAPALANRFQVIRTGSGDISIHTGRSAQLLNQFASIYTAGTRVSNPTLDGTFDVPILNQTGGNVTLGSPQQTTANAVVQYSMAGGDVSITARQDIEHLTRNADNLLVPDSQRELPTNWLYRRGFVDPTTGEFGAGRFGGIASTTWWVDFSNFFQGVGALGGGNVTMIAGQNISNVDGVIPTNARMAKGLPNAGNLLELGGGDLTVRAGNNIDAGVYYVERGHGTLAAGKEITTNATRSPSLTNLSSSNTLDPHTWLPTTLFLGKGGFDVTSRGALTLGPVANAFLLPEGINNTFWFKTTFSTYSPDSFVNISSLGGAVTIRQGATLPASGAGTAVSLLQTWIEKQLLLTLNPESASFYQPWLRLNENSVDPFATAVALMPPTLRATAFSGDINLVGNLTLSPAPLGTMDLLASGAINGLQANGSVSLASGLTTSWGAARINISDANPDAIPGIASPYAYQTVVGISLGQARQTGIDYLDFIDQLFLESGGTLGTALQTKQALHSPGLLHLNDSAPIHFYTGTGDISGLTLFAPKASRLFAGQDILDVALYIQNTDENEPSIVSASRDLLPYNANSPARVAANRTGNTPNLDSGPLAGDIQISGSGTLQVLAGRNIDLGTGLNSDDGTGVGITSIGNARNPYLGSQGANIVIGAGIGQANGLASSSLDFNGFISEFLESPEGTRYLDEVQGGTFDSLPENERDRIALEAFYLFLRDAGRNFATSGNYESGLAAIQSLFGGAGHNGDILTRARDIRTRSGGNISIFTPGGSLTLAETTIGNPLSPPGIVTESGGNISIFADADVNIGIGRIFTLRGGNEIIWSSQGGIAAGASAKTVQSAPPTRVLIDPQSAAVQTDLAGLATGGGIGVLATIQGVTPGDVDLIAPKGIIDAGDAGIRVSGNLNVAAVQLLNADNIQVAGASAGTPAAPAVAVPSLGGLTAPSSSVAANSTVAEEAAKRARTQANPQEELPSIITVEVLGYGGGNGTSDEDDEERRKIEATLR